MGLVPISIIKCFMIKIQILPFILENHFFYISPCTGALLRINKKIDKNTFKLNSKVKDALFFVENPFEMMSYSLYLNNESFNLKKMKKIEHYHRILLKLGNDNFFLSRLYSSLGNRIIENTRDAFDFISQLDIQKNKRHELCLQRAFLASKISQSFKNNGVLFIGASIPSGKMHAWIIEGNTQPDRLDREWVMYRPMLAIYY